MEIEFLGTGTSTGVPQIGCNCATCRSADPHDHRLRTSAIVHADDGTNLLIDCGPDFRTQILRARHSRPDALLVTHSHYDHVGGIDDLRPFCYPHNFPIYARRDVLHDIRTRIPYCFKPHPYPGVPQFDLNEIDREPFKIGSTVITPLPVWHYRLLIAGFIFDRRLAYITDAKHLDPQVEERLHGIPTLVINALRIADHLSHMSLSQSLATIERISPGRALLIHMSHDMGQEKEASRLLPPAVTFAHDTQVVAV